MSTDGRPDETRPIDLAAAAAVAAWGYSQRMSPDLAEAIFDEIVTAPAPESESGPAAFAPEPGLPADWWQDHAAALAATMIASTQWAAA